MGKIMLDTNVFRGIIESKSLVEKIEHTKDVFVSVVVLGELYYGYKGGNREVENKKWLENFVVEMNIKVLSVTEVTAEYYAEIREQLKKIGKPIPSNDIWIAAQAMEVGSVLLTDDGHFDDVEGLRKWSWN